MGAVARIAVQRSWIHVMFPPKSGPKGRQTRTEGDPKDEQISFRAPKDLLEYVNTIKKLGYSKTEVVMRLVYIAKDAAEELAESWWDIEGAANREGITPGRALARFAIAGLKAAEKKK